MIGVLLSSEDMWVMWKEIILGSKSWCDDYFKGVMNDKESQYLFCSGKNSSGFTSISLCLVSYARKHSLT